MRDEGDCTDVMSMKEPGEHLGETLAGKYEQSMSQSGPSPSGSGVPLRSTPGFMPSSASRTVCDHVE